MAFLRTCTALGVAACYSLQSHVGWLELLLGNSRIGCVAAATKSNNGLLRVWQVQHRRYRHLTFLRHSTWLGCYLLLQ